MRRQRIAAKLRRHTVRFTNGILPQTPGGVSFSRWLGCTPMKVARVPPFTSTLGALTGSLSPTAIAKPHGTGLGTRPETPAPAPTRLAVPLCLDEKRPRPTDAGGASEPPTLWFWKTVSSVTRVAQPNESRLSCAAELEYSQMEFYHRRRAASASAAG